MVQALKSGELDYAHDVNPDQFKQLAGRPGVHRGRRQGQRLDASSRSTPTGPAPARRSRTAARPRRRCSTRPSATRSATPSTTRRSSTACSAASATSGRRSSRRSSADWHVEPDHLRAPSTSTLAKQKLDAAGYHLDANGKRLDKEGKPISLRLVYPNTNDSYAKSAQFVKEWYGQLGIDVTIQSYDSDTLGTLVLPPEADPPGTAKYDIELWGWCGQPRSRTRLLEHLPLRPDRHRVRQPVLQPGLRQAVRPAVRRSPARERQATLAQMQNMIYDQAPYDILFYDANLDVYRNDKFAGWQNMPGDGTPFFTYGTARLHAADGRHGPAVGDAGGARRPRRRPRASGQRRRADRGAQRTSAAARATRPAARARTRTLLARRCAVVVVVVIVGGVLLSRPARGGRRRRGRVAGPGVDADAGRGSPPRPSSVRPG